jgi:cytochrome c553
MRNEASGPAKPKRYGRRQHWHISPEDVPMMKNSLACAALLATVFVSAQSAAATAQPGPPSDIVSCTACHGDNGEGNSSGVPRLAGQDAEYLGHALSLFKAGQRAGTVMPSIARGLDDASILRLAGEFSKMRAPSVDATGAPSSKASVKALAGQRLAQIGAPGTPACFSCHAAKGLGNGARFPAIAGQPYQFVVNRLQEFQARARKEAPQPGTMTAISATMNEQQIEEAAAYLSQLPG